jgi:hypothetical protein
MRRMLRRPAPAPPPPAPKWPTDGPQPEVDPAPTFGRRRWLAAVLAFATVAGLLNAMVPPGYDWNLRHGLAVVPAASSPAAASAAAASAAATAASPPMRAYVVPAPPR